MESAASFADIDAFYTKQRPQWDQLKEAVANYEINRFDLEKNEDARKALVRMKEILQAPAPYQMIHESAGLVEAVNRANQALLKKERASAKQGIAGLTQTFEKEAKNINLDKSQWENSVNKFNRLAERTEHEPSISNIKRIVEEAQDLLDQELNSLAQSQEGSKDAPKIKEVETFQIKKVTTKPFLETEEDVDEFTNELGKKLKKAIKENKRIRIE